ncbi:peptidase S8 and S53 subtilisin kexin sedolisin [Kangiella koreensis DSM 16069]|uniref:Peptidase S8 and S53 subtilisin kexin sedolisin n=2 Tax=Kangiella TaxID=261963 RepID=C7R621_KANKD|nr:peptidase S8 and S53 subtilisin kexin sedolisin [Kangiella koreensis DSM 16069]
MKTFKWSGLLLMAGAITVKAATPIDNVVRSVEQRIPEIRQLPEDTIDIQRPEIEFKLPQEAIDDAKQGLSELDKAALKTLDPLQELPKQLAIADVNGKTVLIEQEVENGWRAVANEWLLIIEEQELKQLKKIGAEVVTTTRLQHLDMVVVVFKVPNEMNSRKALEKKLPENWSSQLGRNHIYEANTQQATDTEHNHSEEIGVKKPACDKPVSIGLIDTAIEINHSALKKATIKAKNFMQSNVSTPSGHGTAVAGLLVGGQDQLKPLLPKATLYSASVFYSRNQYSQGATLVNLVRALDWMVANKVRVVNMSLTGPNNPVLKNAIQTTAARGVIIVAAVGNQGPASRPLYPAAYPQVIGATAVDSKQQIYRWANQGEQIDFSAPGVSVITSRANNQIGHETGTSMAAPVVSAFVSCEVSDDTTKDGVVEILRQKAIDLGEKGKDNVFGYGLLQP